MIEHFDADPYRPKLRPERWDVTGDDLLVSRRGALAAILNEQIRGREVRLTFEYEFGQQAPVRVRSRYERGPGQGTGNSFASRILDRRTTIRQIFAMTNLARQVEDWLGGRTWTPGTIRRVVTVSVSAVD